MKKPIIADNNPKKVKVEKGKNYFWCSCGKSSKQPFCDGSHKGTGFTPVKYTPEKDGEVWFCMCKQTKNSPMCDGAHAKLEKKTNTSSTPEEPTIKFIHDLAKNGLSQVGHHGEMAAMGVPWPTLPKWDDIQILTAQLNQKPLLDVAEVGTEVVIGPKAKKPLILKIPLFVSDMSFGALSEEAKTALAKGAELAGTGICSGEGGMLPEEQQENSRYFYELASAKFGYDEKLLKKVQAFHFKGGQAAKTGTGGHLPGNKVSKKIAQVRGLPIGEDAISPSTFTDLHTASDFKKFGDRVREITGGIPIGFKISANHIEDDMEFALKAGADYIILDGRGGGTGAAPLLFRNHISVPTIPALARARKFLNKKKRDDVTLIITGGIRVPSDFIKAMALGADAIALANSAMQAMGCIGARICNTNLCPAGIATQDPELRKLLDVDDAARKLARFFGSSVDLMKIMARACGHDQLSNFNQKDLTTWKKDMADLSGVEFGGID
ncbi:MAG: glutamate synthase [Epsilonproteobacteria bacterium]|nr:MAG: glutamate synthase [Campylobacterota bacterium]